MGSWSAGGEFVSRSASDRFRGGPQWSSVARRAATAAAATASTSASASAAATAATPTRWHASTSTAGYGQSATATDGATCGCVSGDGNFVRHRELPVANRAARRRLPRRVPLQTARPP